MSARELSHGASTVGFGAPYHHIVELVQDRKQIELLADASGISRRNVRKDECDQWTISGKGGHLQTSGDLSSFLLYVRTYSPRKWGAIKRKAKLLGWALTQDGDDEGCFRLGLPDKNQSKFVRELLGLRRKRRAAGAESNQVDAMAAQLSR